jgi:hypothetical protein
MFSVQSFMAGKPSTAGGGGPLYTPYAQLIEPQILRGILYFDTIDWPFTRPGGIETGPRLKVLEEQGFLLRTPAQTPQAMPANLDLISGAHRLVFEQHEVQEPGAWTFAHLLPEPVWGPEIQPTQHGLVEMRGMDFELYRALPMPVLGVPYEEILDFKARREAELLKLRAHLDALYLEIVNSRDVPRAKDAALLQLDLALRDLARVMREPHGLRAIWGSVGITVLFDVLRDVGAAAKAAELLGQTATLGAGIGAVGAAYKFTKRLFQSPIQRTGPLAYVAHAAQEQLVEI